MEPRDDFYLWHLEHIGVLTRAGSGWSAPLWDQARERPPVTVAIIDSGLDTGHPNLEGSIAAEQVDFSPCLTGTVYAAPGRAVAALRHARNIDSAELKSLASVALAEVSDHSRRYGLDLVELSRLHDAVQSAADPATHAEAFLAALAHKAHPPAVPHIARQTDGIAGLNLTEDEKTHLSGIADQMAKGYNRIDIEDPSLRFGAHATACAGLVGGRPPQRRDHPFFSALPYFGVNPFCRIQSFATPYSYEIKPVTHALLAAYLSGAEVILMPRGVPDVAARKALPDSPRRRTRIETLPREHGQTLVDEDQSVLSRLEADRDLFEALMRAVAAERHLVLAAGNDSTADQLAYPASKMVDCSDAIVVGAVNRKGYSASYSNGHAAKDKLLHMVSDDEEALSRDALHMAPWRQTGDDFAYNAHVDPDQINRFSPWAPLSLDVRGSYGFSASSSPGRSGGHDGVDITSLYTLFGGTSAAASLAAGVIALLLQANEAQMQSIHGVTQIKHAMVKAGLRVDVPNT